MSKIRAAVVGLGKGLTHAEAFHLSEHAELCWVVDLDENKAKEAAKQYNCNYSTDWLSVLDDVDAVSLCTPHHLHGPQALHAIRAGKHVILDKPLANSEAECLELIRTADEKGVTLMVGYILRFLPAVRKLKEIVDSGKFGQPINLSLWAKIYWPPAPDAWFSSKKMLGGGVLFAQGCHYMDIIIWLMGYPVQLNGLGTRNGTDWLEGEGTSHSIMRFSNGALGHLLMSWGMKYKETSRKLEINTTDALLSLDPKMEKIEAITQNGREVLFDASKLPPPTCKAQDEIGHFLDCIRHGWKPETDGRESIQSLKAIWSTYAQAGFAMQ
jgi:predicted dehydrogenase